jgi:hypothetical protein
MVVMGCPYPGAKSGNLAGSTTSTAMAWVAGFKSESRPASNRNRWPASYWNWWPASSEAAYNPWLFHLFVRTVAS